MTAGMQRVDLAIDHVGNPAEWMPVTRMEAKSPRQPFEGQTALNVPVLGHVLLVVVSQEIMAQCWEIKREGYCAKGQD
jgi:hypothetical protein